jgi:hypothetical protein
MSLKLVENGPIGPCVGFAHGDLEATVELDGRESFVCVDCGAVFIQEALF